MKIRKLQLKNIGVFDDETINFQECPAKDKAEIHILTGENGSGKTTILMALASSFSTGQNKSLDVPFNKRLKYKKNTQIFNSPEDNSEFQTWFDNDEFTGISENWTNQIAAFRFNFETENSVVKDYRKYCLEPQDSPYELNFAVFAYSGYRRIKDEKINLFDEVEENPLQQALDFVKDENSKFTINQWLGRSLSKRALALEDNSEDAKKFTENVKNLEKVIADIVGYEIRFKLKTDLSLVLIKDNQELDFDVLPDGLKSLISWIGDLLMRLDSLKWENDTPIFDREIILFLDEIEVHLHPAWQRKVLPIVQKLFKNAQIFVSTHSPFVVNSVDDTWVYKLKLDAEGKAKVESVERSEDARSYRYVLRNTFDIESEFGYEVDNDLTEFKELSENLLSSNGNKETVKKELLKKARKLASQSKELKGKIEFELFQLSEITNDEDLSL